MTLVPGKKSVLHIVHNFSSHGGVQEHVRDLAGGLADEFEPYILSPEAGLVTLFDRHGQPVRRYLGAELDWPVVPLKSEPHDAALLTVLEELKPSLIHLHHISGWPLGMPGIVADSGIPWIVTLHDYVWITPHGGMIGALEAEWTFTAEYTTAVYGRDISEFCLARRDFLGNALVRAAARIAPSPYAARTVGSIYPGAYQLVEHGVRAIRSVRNAPASRSVLRFGYCGTMIPQKGWHLLFEAFSRVSREMPDAELHFYGGVPEDPRFVSERVFFHPPYNRSAFPEILSKIDVGVIPSVFAETYCLVLSEYWQAGLPVAVSTIGALGERVTDGQNGRTFLPGDVQRLSEILQWFYFDRSWQNWTLPDPKPLELMIGDYRELYRNLTPH